MSELVLYTSDDGRTRLDLRVDGQTVWLTQLEIAELFQTTKQNVSLHAKNIFEDRELSPEATVKESLTVQTEGKREVQRMIQLYNLDLILAIGYRVRSPRGVQFRQWASTHLKEYIVKGFVSGEASQAEGRKGVSAQQTANRLVPKIPAFRRSENAAPSFPKFGKRRKRTPEQKTKQKTERGHSCPHTVSEFQKVKSIGSRCSGRRSEPIPARSANGLKIRFRAGFTRVPFPRGTRSHGFRANHRLPCPR